MTDTPEPVKDSRTGEEIRTMSVDVFWKLGIVQEFNRLFLHPMGIAISVHTEKDKDGNETATGFGPIWDYRDDPEGMEFGDDMIDVEKVDQVRRLMEAHRDVRIAKFGALVQLPPGRTCG